MTHFWGLFWVAQHECVDINIRSCHSSGMACLAVPLLSLSLWLAEAVDHSPPLWLKQLFTRVSIGGLHALSHCLSLTHTTHHCQLWTGLIQASVSSSSLCLFPRWRLWFTTGSSWCLQSESDREPEISCNTEHASHKQVTVNGTRMIQ